MPSEEFKAGDVVRLKSGGPKMTVVEVRNDGWISCLWFEGSTVYEYNFRLFVLTKVSESNKTPMIY